MLKTTRVEFILQKVVIKCRIAVFLARVKNVEDLRKVSAVRSCSSRPVCRRRRLLLVDNVCATVASAGTFTESCLQLRRISRRGTRSRGRLCSWNWKMDHISQRCPGTLPTRHLSLSSRSEPASSQHLQLRSATSARVHCLRRRLECRKIPFRLAQAAQ